MYKIVLKSIPFSQLSTRPNRAKNCSFYHIPILKIQKAPPRPTPLPSTFPLLDACTRLKQINHYWTCCALRPPAHFSTLTSVTSKAELSFSLTCTAQTHACTQWLRIVCFLCWFSWRFAFALRLTVRLELLDSHSLPNWLIVSLMRPKLCGFLGIVMWVLIPGLKGIVLSIFSCCLVVTWSAREWSSVRIVSCCFRYREARLSSSEMSLTGLCCLVSKKVKENSDFFI